MTEDRYIPEPGDKVSWQPVRPNSGIARGEVDYVNLQEGKAAVFIPPAKHQMGQKHSRRTRFMKSFDQLTLLERPES